MKSWFNENLDRTFQLPSETLICDEELNIYLIPKNSPVVRLNINGTDIFRLALEGKSLGQITEDYSNIYECEPDQIIDDVVVFIIDMVNKGHLV